MLVFIIPIKSPQISSSWELVSKLFERCVKSICNQTSTEFRVVVICNQRPETEFKHPHIIYIEVDFPVPTWSDHTDFTSRELDKSRKIFTALLYARQLNPSHIMFVDADDCVSKHLAEFVGHNLECSGWVIDKGYEYHDGSRFIYRKKNRFHLKCGTAHVIRFDLVNPPENLTPDDIAWDYFYHQSIADTLDGRGVPLTYLPFEGAVYITENKENIYYQKKRILKSFNFNHKKLLRFYGRFFYEMLTSRP